MAPSARARIVIVEGKRAGSAVELGPEKITVGRLASCELPIDEPQSSRKHFEVERRGDEVWLRDLGSKNGTYVNEKRVEGEARLEDGDSLRVGTTVLSFTLGSSFRGRSLEEILADGKVALPLALSVARQAAEALALLHEGGRIHGRLTPAAVLVAESGEVTLEERKDGLSRLDPSRPDVALEAQSASPEEARGLDAGPESDVYALGCILYRALSGAPPYEGELPKILRGHASESPVPPITGRVPGTDAEVGEILDEMLAKKVGARPTAETVAAALAPLAARALKTAEREARRKDVSPREEEPSASPRDTRTRVPSEGKLASAVAPSAPPGQTASEPRARAAPPIDPEPARADEAPAAPVPESAQPEAEPGSAPEQTARWKPFDAKKAILLGLAIFLIFVIASQGTRGALRLFGH